MVRRRRESQESTPPAKITEIVRSPDFQALSHRFDGLRQFLPPFLKMDLASLSPRPAS